MRGGRGREDSPSNKPKTYRWSQVSKPLTAYRLTLFRIINVVLQHQPKRGASKHGTDKERAARDD